MVIGADGKNSLVAKQTQTPVYHELPTQTFSYFGYFSGLPKGLTGMGLHSGRTVFVFPTHEERSMVGVFWRI